MNNTLNFPLDKANYEICIYPCDQLINNNECVIGKLENNTNYYPLISKLTIQKKSTSKEYNYKNLRMIVSTDSSNKQHTEIFKITPHQTIIIKNVCMQIYLIEQLESKNFPIIDEYDKINTFNCTNYSNGLVQLNNDNTNYYKIKFYNDNNNKQTACDTIKQIFNL